MHTKKKYEKLGQNLSSLTLLNIYLENVAVVVDFLGIVETKSKHSLHLLTKPNVVGVGVGMKIKNGIETKTPCIKTYVGQKLPLSALNSWEKLPTEIEDAPIDVVEFGAVKTRPEYSPAAPGRDKRLRPVPIGASIGHFALRGVGSLGGWARDNKTGEVLLLSNWHVLTNYGRGHKGDDIIQPGWGDGGRKPSDTIAFLERWVDVVALGNTLGEAKSNLKAYLDRGAEPPTNRVDAALAKPISEGIISLEVLGLGKIRGRRKARIGDSVVKSGRTTSVTEGKVVDTSADIFVEYPGYGVALFIDQCIVRDLDFSLQGDSGSPVLLKEGQLLQRDLQPIDSSDSY